MAAPSPVRFLWVLAGLFAVVALGASKYPPTFVVWPWLHSTVSALTSAGCAALAVRPRRRLAAFVGGFTVAACFIRAALFFWTVLFHGSHRSQEQQVSFVLAGTYWLALAAIVTDAWSWSVVPWVAARRVRPSEP